MQFHDVAHDPDTDHIYAVGTADLDDPTLPPGTKVIAARFDPMGFPVWFNAYTPVLGGADNDRDLDGASIELTPDALAITARSTGAAFGETAFNLVLGRAAGTPSAATFIGAPDGSPVKPAFSSFERLGDEALLVSGTVVSPDGRELPAMWSIDAFTALPNWIWSPEVEFGTGFSAIPVAGRGPTLAGQVVPIAGPINIFEDALLARTDRDGEGLCPVPIELVVAQPDVLVTPIPVEPIQLPTPDEAGLLVQRGEPVFKSACTKPDPCPGDANGDNVVDFADLLVVLANFGMAVGGGASDGDFDVNGTVDFADLLAVLDGFGTVCA
jgi:hypothetical protein